jgi:hypothetical protein
MQNRRALLIGLLLLPAALPAADKPREDPGKLAEMRRYLRGLQFGDSFQGGIRKINATRDGQSTPFLDRLLAASPEELEATVAPAFARHVTLSEARAMANFINSPLGQRMVQQRRELTGDPQRPVDLSPEELEEVVKFDRTPAGKKTAQLSSDPQIRQEYFALLQARYEK